MISFGPENEIDFGRLNGIIGLFGPNHIGKSSVIDSLAFCLFDITSRTNFARDVMNNKKDRKEEYKNKIRMKYEKRK